MQVFDHRIVRSCLCTALALTAVLSAGQVVPQKPDLKTDAQKSVLPGSVRTMSHKPDAAESASLIDKITQRSRGYIENKGQWPSEAKYMGRSNGLDLWVTKDGLRLDSYVKSDANVTGHVVGIKFLGAKTLKPYASKEVGVPTR